MNASLSKRSGMDRRGFVRSCALAGAGWLLAAPRGAAGNNREGLPEEILYRTMTGRLGLVTVDGQARSLPELDPAVATWGAGPILDGGRRVWLNGVGQGRPWETTAESRFYLLDRVRGRVDELVWPRRPAPFVNISHGLPGERVLGGARVDGEMRLFTANRDGSDLRELTGPGDGFAYGESLCPGGARVAYHAVGITAGNSTPYSIYTVGINGRDRRVIARDPAAYCFGPVWSADGAWIAYQKCAYQTDPGHDRADVWVCRADGTEARRLDADGPHWFSTAFGRPPHPGSGSDGSHWSPRAKVLTYCRLQRGSVPSWQWETGQEDRDHFNRSYRPDAARGGANLLLLDPFGGARVELTPPVERRWDFRAAWSPDGHALAFIRADVGEPSQLWHVQADGTNTRRLPTGPDSIGVDHPRFLPGLPADVKLPG